MRTRPDQVIPGHPTTSLPYLQTRAIGTATAQRPALVFLLRVLSRERVSSVRHQRGRVGCVPDAPCAGAGGDGMTTKRKFATLALALLVLAALSLACTDDWDGMDRRDWPGPTPTCTVCRPDLPPPGGQHTAPAGETGAAAAGR